jgi:glycosyltransferase involved in cell wall biosynthesis
MKMACLSPTGHLGGAERVLLAVLAAVRVRWPATPPHLLTFTDGPLVAAAHERGAKVEVFPLPPMLGRLGDSQLRQSGGGWRRLRLLRQALTAVPALARFAGRLRRRLHLLQPDVIHSNGIKTHVLTGLARPAEIPVVWHLHDFCGARPWGRRLLPWLSRRVAGAVAISGAVGSDAAALLPRLPVTVIANSVDLRAFAPTPGDGAWLDRLAGLAPAPRGVVRIGLVATYARWKGHHCFLDALARLRQLQPAAPFRGYVVGGPLYQTHGSQVTQAELEVFARQAGVADRVGFVPFQRDPAPVYRALDIVVHASTEPEPFGLTIAEGMACGRPVVVSAAGGAAELFTHDHDAVGVPPNHPAALATALDRLADDDVLRQRLGANARQTAVARFGQDRFARQVIDFYERLLAGQPAAAPASAAAQLLDTRA